MIFSSEKSCVMFFFGRFFLVTFLIKKTVFNYHQNTCFGNLYIQLCPKESDNNLS